MPRGWVTMDGKPVPWETCQTFSGSWGYHRDETSWKSVRQLIVMLVETVSKGGNLLLNVGPTARGTFDGRATERLNGIGEWMKLHCRSIYGCTQAPETFPSPPNCLLTFNQEAGRIYVHILEWPMGVLHLDGFGGKIKYAQLLNDASEVKFSEQASEGGYYSGKRDQNIKATVDLRLPLLRPNVEVPVVEIFLK